MPTCPALSEHDQYLATRPAEPYWGSLTFQHVMLIISGIFSAATLFVSMWLIIKHLHRYTVPREQRQIIRILFTPVVFSLLATGSIANYSVAKYLAPLQDIYESFAFVAVFLLFLEFAEPDPWKRPQFFHKLENRSRGGKVISGGSYRWFNVTWISIFQFCVVITIIMIVQEITQATNSYCISSLKPKYAHLWILIIQKLSTIHAVLALIRFYLRLKGYMAGHHPLMKLVSFKLIVGVNFFQTLIFSILADQSTLDGNAKTTQSDLSIGLPQFMTSIENFCFAVFFHYAFRSREYHAEERQSEQRMRSLQAAADAFNPTDLITGIVHTFDLLLGKSRQSPNYNNAGPKIMNEGVEVQAPNAQQYGRV